MDAIEAVDFAARGKVVTTVDNVLPLEALPQIYEDMTAHKVIGRVVLNLYVFASSLLSRRRECADDTPRFRWDRSQQHA